MISMPCPAGDMPPRQPIRAISPSASPPMNPPPPPPPAPRMCPRPRRARSPSSSAGTCPTGPTRTGLSTSSSLTDDPSRARPGPFGPEGPVVGRVRVPHWGPRRRGRPSLTSRGRGGRRPPLSAVPRGPPRAGRPGPERATRAGEPSRPGRGRAVRVLGKAAAVACFMPALTSLSVCLYV